MRSNFFLAFHHAKFFPCFLRTEGLNDPSIWPDDRTASLEQSSLQNSLQKSKIRAGERVTMRARLLVGA